MGTKAEEVSDQIEKARVNKHPEGNEMLKFFKYPYAVYCSQEYLSLLRETLSSQLSKLQQDGAAITGMQLKNTLNLLTILQANVDCLAMIKIKPKSFLSEEERQRMRDLQEQLDQVELDYVSVTESSDNLTQFEIILKQHIYQAANKLNEAVEVNFIDVDITKLSKLDYDLSETSQANSQLSKERSLEFELKHFLWSANNQDSFKELFQNSSTELLAQTRGTMKHLLAKSQQNALKWF